MKSLKLLTMTALLGLAMSVQAVDITGGISLTGGLSLNAPMGTATAFTSFYAGRVADVSGSYVLAGVNPGDSVLMTPFTFKPYGDIPTPPQYLWVTIAPAVFAAFDLDSAKIDFQNANNLLLSGSGTLFLTGYHPTKGEWHFSSQTASEGTFSWSSTNGSVPDGGVTAMLIGGALAGLAFVRRKLA